MHTRMNACTTVKSCMSVLLGGENIKPCDVQADALMADAEIGVESNAADREHARMPFELRALEVALDVVSFLFYSTLDS